MKKELLTPVHPVVTNAKLIDFYMYKAAHYPISDLFMMNYRQKEGGYIDLYSTFHSTEHNGKPDNVEFYKMVVEELNRDTAEAKETPLTELDRSEYKEFQTEYKMFQWMLKRMPEKFILCQVNQSDSGLEPNQKWHFLVSWAAFALVAGKIKKVVYSEATQKYPQENAFKEKTGLANSFHCPELLLWMLEAAVDGENLTAADVSACYADAVTCRLNGTNRIQKDRKKEYLIKLENAILTATGKTPVL